MTIVYNLTDREFNPVDIEVEFGIDLNLDDQVTEDEFQAATAAPGGDGTLGLSTSPGKGSQHTFIWNSLADVTSGRYVTQDYVYTTDGRVALDEFGDPIFEDFPGTWLRLRPIARGKAGEWQYTPSAFDLNNNNKPSVTIQGVDIPPEGVADGTVNEQVLVNWTAKDPDDDPVTIAVDWAIVPAGYDPTTKDDEEKEALPWNAASSGDLGEGSHDLDASRVGIAHKFSWDSVPDAGTMHGWILIRIRPIDGKREVGLWVYADSPFLLDNYTIFTDPDSALSEARAGSEATLLLDKTVIITGGGPTEGSATNYAAIFYPGLSQTTKGTIAEQTTSMLEARAMHTATRLLDGRVLVAGGVGGAAGALNTAEIYDPVLKSFTATGSAMATARKDHVAVLLRDGNVFLAGGVDASGTPLASAEIYNVATDSFLSAGAMTNGARTGARGSCMPDGRVLIAGGSLAGGPTPTIEIFDPIAGTFTAVDIPNNMTAAREGMSLTSTTFDPYVATAAGGMASPPTNSIESFDWDSDSWMLSGVTMREGRANHMAVRLGDGKILIAGGQTTDTGTLTATADIYDVATDTIDLPNGDMHLPLRDAAITILENGRPALFGGMTTGAATGKAMIFTPDGGFNYPPIAQVRTPTAVEPWAFGVRFNWRATDIEGDNVRIVPQFQIRASATDDSGALGSDVLGVWLPATMKDKTVLGETSSGLTNLSSRTTYVDQVTDPIDAPDVDPGEHLFVWYTEEDIPKGNYDNVFFRIFIYGATEGTTATSGRFSITENAPVIARIETPLTTYGNMVFPYWLQDSDRDELARVHWEYGIDLNGDGKILDTDGEVWADVTHATVSVDVPGEAGTPFTDTGTTDLVTGSRSVANPPPPDDPNNEFTDEDGIPWGKKHYLIWDTVYNLGAPTSPRDDIILRVTPYDYPAPGDDESLGIEREISGFTLERDPNALLLESFMPTVTSTSGGGYLFDGVKVNEPIEFQFSVPVEPTSLNSNTVQIYKGSGSVHVEGFFFVDNSSGKGLVTFYPQVQESPALTTVLEENTGYTVRVPGYDPSDRTQPLVQRLGADPDDTNARNCLDLYSTGTGFRTGSGAIPDAAAPAYESRMTPATSVDVGSDSKIVIVIDDNVLPSTVIPANFQVVATAFTGVESIVPGTFTLRNITDDSGPGGTVRTYAEITFTPLMPLPPDAATIVVKLGTGLKDLAGNGLSSAATTSFTTGAATASNPRTTDEDFTSKDNRDDDETTAFWGDNDPAGLIDMLLSGSGTSGSLTGLFEAGDGSDGALTFSGTTLTINTDTKSEWKFTKFEVPVGYTVTVTGSKPAVFRIQQGAEIHGTVDARGEDGGGSYVYNAQENTGKSGYGYDGGEGGAGGGDGGANGYYTWGTDTYNSTTGVINMVDGEDGEAGYGDSDGTGGGEGGPGGCYYYYYRSSPYVSRSNYGYYAAGGGGGAHATDGGDGQLGYSGNQSSGGAGGEKYGDADLANGKEAGGGGGAGGTVYMFYDSNGTTLYIGCNHGYTGGGGGGYLQLTANQDIVIGGGQILADGGDGNGSTSAGRLYYLSSSYLSVYPGGSGGGGGGTVLLQTGAEIKTDSTSLVSATGGIAGPGYSSGTSVDTRGGAGGGGRIRVEAPGAEFAPLVDFRGQTTKGTVSSVDSGSSTSWTVTGTVTVDTDNGKGAPSGVFSNGKFLVDDFTISSGATLYVTGENPFHLNASGDVNIEGTLDASGSNGLDGAYQYNRSYSGFYQPTQRAGGSGGPNGGQGGDAAYNTSSTIKWTLPTAEDGYSPDGVEGGTGGGEAGGPMTKPFTYHYVSGSYEYKRYYFYLSGCGGGGGSADEGGAGSCLYNSGSGYYYYDRSSSGTYTYRYDHGEYGDGGSATVPDGDKLTASNIKGGGGGAGGMPGGYMYDYSASSGNSDYAYCYCYPASGGGGGGAVYIGCEGEFTLSGLIDVSGGTGGSHDYTSYYQYVGCAGGGGGGNVLLEAIGDFVLDSPVIDASGGSGGTVTKSSPSYSLGGNGSEGRIVLRGTTAPVFDSLTESPWQVGKGSVSVGDFLSTNTAVSVWYDSNAVAPDYQSAAMAGPGPATLYIEGAQSHPLTGEPDPANTTGWVLASEYDKLDGHRYHRFKVVLAPGAAAGSMPSATGVTISYLAKE